MAYSGSGTQADPYLVGTIDDLASVLSGAGTKYIKMTNDLDWTGRSNVTETLSDFRSHVYIDGNNTKWTNIALINCTLFKNSGAGAAYELFTINNLDIEYLQVFNNNTVRDNLPDTVWLDNKNSSLVLIDCIIHAKLYYLIFDSASTPGLIMGFRLGDNNIDGSVTKDVALRTNFTIDFYNIGTNGKFQLDTGFSSTSNDHYVRDCIIKISYYDENGWAKTSQGDAYPGNFTNSTSLDASNDSWYPLCVVGTYVAYNQYYYKPSILVNSGVFVRYYADVNMNDKKSLGLLGPIEVVNSYFIYECMRGLYLQPDLRKVKFSTYSFYDITKSPTMHTRDVSYSYSASQLAGLTTSQCKSRLSFEGPDAIIPFKLKQTT